MGCSRLMGMFLHIHLRVSIPVMQCLTSVLTQTCALQMNLRFLEQATAPSRMASIREDFLLQDFVPIAG